MAVPNEPPTNQDHTLAHNKGGLGFGRHALYYPYFHVRDERWLKLAALYWPKLVRIVPDGYRTRDSDTVLALGDEFIVRLPPGRSVDAVAPLFVRLSADHADRVRPVLGVLNEQTELARWFQRRRTRNLHPLARRAEHPLTGVHVTQVAPAVLEALQEAGLAVAPDTGLWHSALHQQNRGWPESALDGRPHADYAEWVVMRAELAAVYTTVLAQDFAAANSLQPTTDQEDAYTVATDWTTDGIAAALLHQPRPPSPSQGELAQRLGFLALDVVVPAHLDTIPVQKILEVRRRYGAEFFAFGRAVDEAATALAQDLPHITDQVVLENYLRDIVATQFDQPREELRRALRRAMGDAALASINVKVDLPAGAAIAGGAWLTGHPLLAGTLGAAIGLMTIGRGARQQRDAARQSSLAVSYLLHTESSLQAHGLLARTLARLTHMTGDTH
ncbi:hypothetical protein SAMN04489712_105457 [Thermomonospora echinospora]|uniref:Uncharacterized protein n=1 Tax=Thermomonospora echinospora TaxID=1992 RepID=A0A1H6AI97_9ACTN|nr:DUF6236 family protein [Thermomonospora echinospora]SEG48112.1 hypothetical protein SAMN04489712_105457 [Thermomonospora echinospora]